MTALLAAIACAVLVIASGLNGPVPGPPHSKQAGQTEPARPDKNSDGEHGVADLPSTGRHQASAKQGEIKADSRTGSTEEKATTDWWMFGITVVLALVGALQLWVFGLQAKRLKETIEKMDEVAKGQSEETRQSIQIANETMRVAHRATLVVSQFAADTINPGVAPLVTFRIANKGQTHAEIVDSKICIAIGGRLTGEPDYSVGQAGRVAIVFPDSDTLEDVRFREPLQSDQVTYLTNNPPAQFLLVWGRITYRTVFNELFDLGFTVELWGLGPFVRERGSGWRFHSAPGYNYVRKHDERKSES